MRTGTWRLNRCVQQLMIVQVLHDFPTSQGVNIVELWIDKRSRQLSSKITSMGRLLCRTFNVQECATFIVSLVGAAAPRFSSLHPHGFFDEGSHKTDTLEKCGIYRYFV